MKMPKNLFAIGSHRVVDMALVSDIIRDKIKSATFNSGYNVYYVENVTLNTKFYLAWSEFQKQAEESNISWFSIIVGEDYDDIEIESFEATIDSNEDFLLHEVFGIETTIIYNFM